MTKSGTIVNPVSIEKIAVENETNASTKTQPVMDSTSSPEIVRCHCNLPQCVRTGYMCRSMEGACFTRYLRPLRTSPREDKRVTRTRKNRRYQASSTEAPLTGCLEDLPLDMKQHCLDTVNAGMKEPSSTGGLQCCVENVCNFQDMRGAFYVEPDYGVESTSSTEISSQSLVYLKAAAITVPIVGLFFLSILIFLARRFLTYNTYSRKGYKTCKERQLKVPLFPGGSVCTAIDHRQAPLLCAESLLQKSGSHCSKMHSHLQHLKSVDKLSSSFTIHGSSSTGFNSASTIYTREFSPMSHEELEPLNSSRLPTTHNCRSDKSDSSDGRFSTTLKNDSRCSATSTLSLHS